MQSSKQRALILNERMIAKGLEPLPENMLIAVITAIEEGIDQGTNDRIQSGNACTDPTWALTHQLRSMSYMYAFIEAGQERPMGFEEVFEAMGEKFIEEMLNQKEGA